MRVCAESGCPELTDTTRCVGCTRAKDKARGSSTARGYGAKHQARRAEWVPVVAQGGVDCARCHRPIGPNDAWDLDHRDDRTGYLGPSHAACNRATSGPRNGLHNYADPGTPPSPPTLET